jgi:hypothetical protein
MSKGKNSKKEKKKKPGEFRAKKDANKAKRQRYQSTLLPPQSTGDSAK